MGIWIKTNIQIIIRDKEWQKKNQIWKWFFFIFTDISKHGNQITVSTKIFRKLVSSVLFLDSNNDAGFSLLLVWLIYYFGIYIGFNKKVINVVGNRDCDEIAVGW